MFSVSARFEMAEDAPATAITPARPRGQSDPAKVKEAEAAARAMLSKIARDREARQSGGSVVALPQSTRRDDDASVTDEAAAHERSERLRVAREQEVN